MDIRLTIALLIFVLGVIYNLYSSNRERRIKARPYFDLVMRTLPLNVDKTFYGKTGRILTTDTYTKFQVAKQRDFSREDDPLVTDCNFLIIKNLGPEFALDCLITIDCYNYKIKDNKWQVEAYVPVVEKEEDIFIPIDDWDNFPSVDISKIEIDYRSQHGEHLILEHKVEKVYGKNTPYQTLYRELLGFRTTLIDFRSKPAGWRYLQ